MSFIFKFISLVLIQSTLQNWYESKDILEITEDNIEEIIGKQNHVFVKFFRPWCHYCKIMHHDWIELDKQINVEHKIPDVLVARVNCEEQEFICEYYKIDSYPALKFFQAENSDIFADFRKNQRTVKDFISYIQNTISKIDKYNDLNKKLHHTEINQQSQDTKQKKLEIELDPIKLEKLEGFEDEQLLLHQKNQTVNNEYIQEVKFQQQQLLDKINDIDNKIFNYQLSVDVKINEIKDNGLNAQIFIYLILGIVMGIIFSQQLLKTT